MAIKRPKTWRLVAAYVRNAQAMTPATEEAPVEHHPPKRRKPGRLPMPEGKAANFTVSFMVSGDMASLLGDMADQAGVTRSTIVRELVTEALEGRGIHV